MTEEKKATPEEIAEELNKRIKELEAINDMEIAYRQQLNEISVQRAKTITVLLPLIRQGDLTELLAELWDLRAENKHRLKKFEKKVDETK